MTRDEFRDYVNFLRSQDEISYDVYSGLIDGIDTLEQAPRIGHWISIEKTNTYTKWKCSECGMLSKNAQVPWYKHCPGCGAKMVEPQESVKV